MQRNVIQLAPANKSHYFTGKNFLLLDQIINLFNVMSVILLIFIRTNIT